MMWIFVGNSSGMPLEVRKCDFEPSINPPGKSGRWVAFVERDSALARLVKLEAAARDVMRSYKYGEHAYCDLAHDALQRVLDNGESGE